VEIGMGPSRYLPSWASAYPLSLKRLRNSYGDGPRPEDDSIRKNQQDYGPLIKVSSVQGDFLNKNKLRPIVTRSQLGVGPSVTGSGL